MTAARLRQHMPPVGQRIFPNPPAANETSSGGAMATATDLQTGLAYDIEGSGTPVVFLHGLTFDRRTWRPVIDQLDGAVTSIAIDLPAHGDSGGEPAPLERVAELRQPSGQPRRR